MDKFVIAEVIVGGVLAIVLQIVSKTLYCRIKYKGSHTVTRINCPEHYCHKCEWYHSNEEESPCQNCCGYTSSDRCYYKEKS